MFFLSLLQLAFMKELKSAETVLAGRCPRACLLRLSGTELYLQMFQWLLRETRGEISTSGVDFNERMSPTGKTLDDLSSHVSQLLVWVGAYQKGGVSQQRQTGTKSKGQRATHVHRLFAV